MKENVHPYKPRRLAVSNFLSVNGPDQIYTLKALLTGSKRYKVRGEIRKRWRDSYRIFGGGAATTWSVINTILEQTGQQK